MCQVDVVHRAFHQEPLDDGVDADDSSTEGDEGVSPKEVIRSFQLKKNLHFTKINTLHINIKFIHEQTKPNISLLTTLG